MRVLNTLELLEMLDSMAKQKPIVVKNYQEEERLLRRKREEEERQHRRENSIESRW